MVPETPRSVDRPEEILHKSRLIFPNLRSGPRGTAVTIGPAQLESLQMDRASGR